MLTLASNVQPVNATGGTIYIRADGSIDPPTADITTTDNVTYTFTDNIFDFIVVERDNIVIDGAGYALQGTGAQGTLISLTGRTNVTIRNAQISNPYGYAIWLDHSSHINISGNNITDSYFGIRLNSSSNNIICRNNITAHRSNYQAIWIDYSSDNSITRNNIIANTYGLVLYYSFNNNISENNIADNMFGLHLYHSSSNSISRNRITANTYFDISLYYHSDSNSISENNIENSDCGISFHYSSSNSVSENNVMANNNGIWFYETSGNKFYHNNFIDNGIQVNCTYSPAQANVWDDGYPSGGNYWSDYAGVDTKSGLNQDIPGSDELGDTPYVVDVSNQDRYPLMAPWPILFDPNGDGEIDIKDLAVAAGAFGSYPGHSRWNPFADINRDGIVDIRDLVIIAKNYGKKY